MQLIYNLEDNLVVVCNMLWEFRKKEKRKW
jgi:hypothetical protein